MTNRLVRRVELTGATPLPALSRKGRGRNNQLPPMTLRLIQRYLPLPMRITLARRILETTETPSIAEPPRTMSLDEVIGLLKTNGPPPTDEECERIIEEERMGKYR